MNTKKLAELYVSFFKIGGLTFGGGLAMLPMLQREVVQKHGWCTEEELLDIYAIGQCTPGIIAVNTATYVGYKQAGFIGGVSGTLGMVSPSLIIICLVASILNNFIHMPVVLHALAGIRIVVCALMLNTEERDHRQAGRPGLSCCLYTGLLYAGSNSAGDRLIRSHRHHCQTYRREA